MRCDIVYSYTKKISISSYLINAINFANLLECKDSKSFLSVLTLLIRGILYPNARLFTTAGGKEQAAQILQEKIQDICNKIPAFEREIDFSRGATRIGKDQCRYVLKSGSTIENVAARESSRGRRMHGGIIEECVGVDQKVLQEVVIPMMNVSRRCKDGTVQENEALNQSQIYINFFGQNVIILLRKNFIKIMIFLINNYHQKTKIKQCHY